MSTFEVVTIVVSVIAIALAATSYFGTSRVLSELGRRGLSFDHLRDSEVAERPSEEERDDPIPKRTLRGRPD